MKEKKIQKRYNEEFKRQAVELLIHSGKRQAQVARELGVSDYTLTLWKRAYLGQLKPGELEGKPLSPEEMLETIRQLQKENEYLKRQREILKKAMSIVGEEPNPGMPQWVLSMEESRTDSEGSSGGRIGEPDTASLCSQ